MSKFIGEITEAILSGENISYSEGLQLINIDHNDSESMKDLLKGADEIREKYNGDKVDLCSIMNGKSGKCSEDCTFCAQSSHYNTETDEYPLISYDEIYTRAKDMCDKGIDRFSIVTSGKGVTTDDFNELIKIYSKLEENIDLNFCASHGVISYDQALSLKKTGVNTIKHIKKSGMDVCSGVIIGMGETIEDRINMMFEIKELDVSSIPVNVLNPIKGTPLENLDTLEPMEILKTIAVFRYINPKAHIRYAGGRNALGDKQHLGLRGGVNAMLVGDYLTSIGSDISDDKRIIESLGLNY